MWKYNAIKLGSFPEIRPIPDLDHLLQAFERQDFNCFTGRFSLEHGFFASKWVDALACRACLFLDDLNLEHAWHIENTWAAWLEVALDDTTE